LDGHRSNPDSLTSQEFHLLLLRSVNKGKEEVASTAQSNDTPQEVVDRIRKADTFNSADEVLQAVQGRL
jgi:hypothetical protein